MARHAACELQAQIGAGPGLDTHTHTCVHARARAHTHTHTHTLSHALPAGAAKYGLRVLAAHRQVVRAVLTPDPDTGRLVMRQYTGKKREGPVMLEAAMQGGPLKGFPAHLVPAAEPETPCGGCRATLHPRADPVLTATLLALFKWRLDRDAMRAAVRRSKKLKPERKENAGGGWRFGRGGSGKLEVIEEAAAAEQAEAAEARAEAGERAAAAVEKQQAAMRRLRSFPIGGGEDG